MNIYTEMDIAGYERVVRCDNEKVGFTSWAAVHDTTMGPALGGCRVWNYESDELALTDALRLSKGMTYKNALAGLPLGGGKSVIRCDPAGVDRKQLFSEYGKFIDYLEGLYITAEDVNSTLADMEIVKKLTNHVATVGASGNPSPFTAYGVYCAIRSAVLHKMMKKNLQGLAVAIQGAGETGGRLAKLLTHDGANLFIADINDNNIRRLKEKIPFTEVDTEDIYQKQCDIFSPCALGGILNSTTIPKLRCSIIAGSANNQLMKEEDGDALSSRGILYAPDFVVNAGGVINISCEIGQTYDSEKAMAKTAEIGNTTYEIFDMAEAEGLPTNRIANRIAENLIAKKKLEKEPLLKTG